MNRLNALQAEAPRERIGYVELATGFVRAAIDYGGEHAQPVVGEIDARAAWQRWMRDAERLRRDDAAACRVSSKRCRSRRADERDEVANRTRCFRTIVSPAADRERNHGREQRERREREQAAEELHGLTRESEQWPERVAHELVELGRQRPVGRRVVAKVAEHVDELLIGR